LDGGEAGLAQADDAGPNHADDAGQTSADEAGQTTADEAGTADSGPQPAEDGSLRIADEAVAIIAGMAAMEVEGVAGMSGGIAGGIAEILGRQNLSKGVEVEVGEREAAIDLYIIVEYGQRMPDVAWNVQEKVKASVQSMTGYTVTEVNIHIQGVSARTAAPAE